MTEQRVLDEFERLKAEYSSARYSEFAAWADTLADEIVARLTDRYRASGRIKRELRDFCLHNGLDARQLDGFFSNVDASMSLTSI